MARVDIPEHMKSEQYLSKIWFGGSAFLGISLMAIMVVGMPFWHWSWFSPGISRHWLDQMLNYPNALLENGRSIHWQFYASKPYLTSALIYISAFPPSAALVYFLQKLNPYRSAFMLHGDAQFGRMKTIEQMEQNRQVGRTGEYLHFGFFNNEKLALIETLSVLALAPPGTGKTAGLVIPSILDSDQCCMLVNDPKPELWEATSGYRATLGPTYRLEWSAVDEPEKDIWYPRFNFLNPRLVPPAGPHRDTFLDAVAKTLIPEPKGGGETYFINRGRAALTGFLQMLVAKINDRDDPDRYEGITKRFRGKEASLPMLVDWLVESQQNTARSGPGDDPMRPIMQAFVDEAREWEYPQRAITELTGLINVADKERSGILGTMEEGLLAFKNAAVVERSSSSDFAPEDLRGKLTEKSLQSMGLDHYPDCKGDWEIVQANPSKQEWKPISVYVCINQAVASSFATITSLFFETCSKTLLAYGPGEVTNNGTLMGPYPTCFCIDEFAKLPKISAVLEGPDLGRSKKTFYLLVAQDYGQIGKTYSKEDQSLIDGTTAVKVILPQNNPDSIERIAKMAGKTTVKRHTVSKQTGFGSGVKMFGGSQSESQEGVNLLSTSNLASMPAGKHLVMVQNFLNQPIWVKTPMYFHIPRLLVRAYNPRTKKGPKPAPPMPEFVREQIVAKLMQDQEFDRHRWKFIRSSWYTERDVGNQH